MTLTKIFAPILIIAYYFYSIICLVKGISFYPIFFAPILHLIIVLIIKLIERTYFQVENKAKN